LKESAISEPGIATRTADTATAALKRPRWTRDFFVLRTTFAAAYRTLRKSKLDLPQSGKSHLDTRFSHHPSSFREGAVLALQKIASKLASQKKTVSE
jgi:hypothetical protein